LHLCVFRNVWVFVVCCMYDSLFPLSFVLKKSCFWVPAQKPPRGSRTLLGNTSYFELVSGFFQKPLGGIRGPLGGASSVGRFCIFVGLCGMLGCLNRFIVLYWSFHVINNWKCLCWMLGTCGIRILSWIMLFLWFFGQQGPSAMVAYR